MGPRFNDRGEPVKKFGMAAEWEASMGPRFNDRGEFVRSFDGPFQFFASMGPRFNDRGERRAPPPRLRSRRRFNGAAVQ